MQALLNDEPPAVSALNTLTQTYRIVAFVLHDPDVDTAFHQVMRDHFGALHRITGRQVLFFVTGLGKQDNDPKMENVRSMTNDLAARYSKSGARQQPGNGVPLVAQALGLASKLPGIVFVDATERNPQRNHWFWMTTNAKDVWWHLERLAAYEQAQYEARVRREGRGPPIQNFLHGALPLELHGRQDKVKFVGEYLGAASQSGSQRLSHFSANLVNDLASIGQRVEGAAEAARKNSDEHSVQLVEEIAHEANTKLRVLTPSGLPYIAFLEAGIHHESRVNVVSAWYAKQALDQWAPTLAVDAAAFGLSVNDLPSYTGPVVELGSAVEREVVLSAGQALRAYVDLPVPLAFNRFYKTKPLQDFTLTGTSTRKAIDLNRRQRGGDMWLPPSIGLLRSAFYEIAAPEGRLLNWPAGLSLDQFVSEWEAMSAIRNDAAHANRPITGEDFDLLLTKMNDLKVRGDLDWIVSTKRHLQDPMFTKAQLWQS
ncbi:hypothetical protein [Deinococcus sp. RIT780]|uniref:hypothetical protein n=1 Tax=Deinococcus sp. RIT780 TaxID=2870472 RepID=UPI001C898CD0|nr:hypothetical protein [Deinococcus sp. RIT780]MBX8463666.1 hypothetical protein [Deinococcus sp. RIT780]